MSNLAIGFTNTRAGNGADTFIEQPLDKPVPDGHDVLVKVQAISVNPVDTKERQKDATESFRILGFDAAGVVEAVGDKVTLFRPGDEVYYAGQINRAGSNQQYQLVDERIVGQKPNNLTYAEAASLPLTTITAWESLFDRFRLTPKIEGTMVVIGATGGVGSIMLQLLSVLFPKITVIATASSPEKREWVKQFGAAHVVNHHEDLEPQILEIAPEGVEWVFTTHSTGQLPLYERILKPFGEIVALEGGPHDVAELKMKSLTWHWELMFTKPVFRTANMIDQHRLLNEVAELVDTGQIQHTKTTELSPISPKTLQQAHELVESGTTLGKIVISGWQ